MDQKSVPKISFYLERSTRQRFTNGNTLSTLSAWGQSGFPLLVLGLIKSACGLSASIPAPQRFKTKFKFKQALHNSA
jgi:hypothetical protein